MSSAPSKQMTKYLRVATYRFHLGEDVGEDQTYNDARDGGVRGVFVKKTNR